MRIVAIEQMLSLSVYDGRITNMSEFSSQFATSRVFDLKWQQHMEYGVLSRQICGLIGESDCYIHFNERGIWPSSENRFLFRALLNFCLNSDDLQLDDAIKFERGEGDAAASFLQLGLQFGWGGLFIRDRDRWFYFSHDGWGYLSAPVDAIRDLAGIYGVQVSRPPGYGDESQV
jgi:hypothetical protein